MPLFALIGVVTIVCFLLWPENDDPLTDLNNLIERINGLADTENLLAVPLFMLSGSIMARGEISKRLIDFSKALIGWLPGGLAVSAVVACMLFAAISGSSPATVVAIGAMMAPTLIKHGHEEWFTHGLLTSSGSLGILIPPSIPMIIYPLINQRAGIDTSELFASGFGPGLVIGGLLAGFCIYRGVKGKASRQPFSLATLGESLRDGLWSLLFPILILGGIYTGFFTVVEASAVSVVYAVLIELFVHRALEFDELPSIVQETGIILGSLLVIMVSALAFSEFLHFKHVPDLAVEWIESLDLRPESGQPIAFLLILNLLLLLVGMLMDILSAMFLFIPLLAPIAATMGVDPMHFGIIFIVNLEIGYLTPPVGLNLFVASTLFKKPLGHMIRSVAPFIVLMFGGLMLITFVPEISVGFGQWILGAEDGGPTSTPTPLGDDDDDFPDELPDDDLDDAPDTPDGVQSIEDMMRELEGGGDDADDEDEGDDHVQSMEEMMQELEDGADEDGADEDVAPPEEEAPEAPAEPDHVQSMEEMMREAGME
ncbi:MAG: TRAP transporter large permease subunit [Sandaracinaceae bacterium]|nr:TRAP transporter large permease subunit [Sandaracinaceae bacterium]